MSELTRVINDLEARGHRMTAPRVAVLAETYAAPDAFTADDVNQRLRHIGRATVFRTLKLLVDEDVLCRVLLEGGGVRGVRYRWSVRRHHHHLVCKDCDAVEDLERCGIPGLLADAVERAGFSMEGHWLEVYGRCAACRARADAGRSVSA